MKLTQQKAKSLSHEDEQTILRYYRSTPTVQLAERLGMAKGTVRYHANRLGLRKFSSAPVADTSEVDDIEIYPKLNCWGRPLARTKWNQGEI